MAATGTSSVLRGSSHVEEAPMSEAVTTAFVRLFDAGLIYREKKMNWCYCLQSAISDSEVSITWASFSFIIYCAELAAYFVSEA